MKYIITTVVTYIKSSILNAVTIALFILSHIYISIYIIAPILLYGKYNILSYNTLSLSIIYTCIYALLTLVIVIYIHILDTILSRIFRNTNKIFRFKHKN